jgi:glycolate oxidase
MSPADLLSAVAAVVGAEHVRTDEASRASYGVDALGRGHPADLVVFPGSALDVSRIAALCNRERIPLTPRGAGTGYTGGAVPSAGGVVLSLERMNRILEVDTLSLLAVVEPHVVTATLQAAVEEVGLFYPPDPASLNESVIGGNVAECAGGPRAFKYGTTKRYVLGLEAVLPTGEVIRTGGKSVKNVVGYNLTQLLVGSEGTLAIVTQIILRLIPKPPARATLRAMFRSIPNALDCVAALVADGIVPAALELIDRPSLMALEQRLGAPVAPVEADAMLLIEVDGMPDGVAEEIERVGQACERVGAIAIERADSETERARLWRERRDLSLALRDLAPRKINHDVVVPKGRIPALFEAIDRLREEFRLPIPCFGHVGDGNIHVNILVDPSDADAMARAARAERRLFETVVRLEGSISGEHGIGFSKAPFIGLELSPDTIALMRRLKRAFDPNGILNPGKIFPE